MRRRRFFSSPFAVLMVATVLGLGLLTLELPAQGPVAAVSTVFTNALAERDALPPAEGSLWRFEGPRNWLVGGHYMGLAPYSGRINEVAIHPQDPQIMYATSATGGVWKTMDGGLQWMALGGSDWPTQGATAVAIDPRDPNRVFVGTGDYKRLDHVPPFSVGIMRSLDGGATWKRSGPPRCVSSPSAGL